ncbi:DHH family phosphoesterase [Mycoplasma phocoenae]|uniref:GGDEF domain-containing protein n=1 Tax=Mycoplasma phocoenae TaxID=754517 RepID=A0A858U7Q8_9MOLU|nr:DHH family phosphoesterase [Mycoplasma phocoenae]QJG66808.1 hypothetical protein HGG69_00470 [Mycoplasma phocoenae]
MKQWTKKNFNTIITVISILCLFIIPVITSIVFIELMNTHKLVAVIGLSITTGVIVVGMIILFSIVYKNIKNNIVIKNTLNFQAENEISKSGVGVIIFSDRMKMIWVSDFIKERFGNKIINKHVKEYFGISQSLIDVNNFEFTHNDYYYEINFNTEKNLLLIRDITKAKQIYIQYEKEKIVFGELDIDSMGLYQSMYTEEEIFKIYNSVVNVLDDLTKNYDFVYRRYFNNRFFLTTNKQTLDKFVASDFKFFTNILCNELRDKQLRIPVSVGFAYDSNKLDHLTNLAKNALIQSQSRGGDQITVLDKNNKPSYFGSKTEIALNMNRTKISFIAKSILEKLKSSKIKNVIIYGHKTADLDAIGAAYAMLKIARAHNKKAYIQNKTFDQTAQATINKYLKSELDLFITPAHATKMNGENTMVIIVDTAELHRIENSNALLNIMPENIFVLDHHRISKTPEKILTTNMYVDTGASSTAEIVTELAVFSQTSQYITAQAAQMLLDGIFMDTNKFEKTTTSKTFNAVSLLEEWGASAAKSIETLKMNEKVHEKVKDILSNIKEIKKGYYLATYEGEAEGDVVAIAAEEILRIKDRKAAFVIAKIPGTQKYKMSARGIKTNVQIIAEALNGGGHFAAAAAISDGESLEIFEDNLIQAIVSVKNESDIN